MAKTIYTLVILLIINIGLLIAQGQELADTRQQLYRAWSHIGNHCPVQDYSPRHPNAIDEMKGARNG